MATVTVTVADADGNTMNSDRASLTFTVTVETPPLGVRVSPDRLSLAEGGSGTYTVVLSYAPTGPVTVGVSSDNPAVTVGAGSLNFTTQNWNTAQSVTVTAQGDADAVDEAATITNAASGGGFNGVSGFVRVGVADDEPSAGTDYDADNDGLIDVDSLAKLNAMRWDLDGDGAPSSGNAADYTAAFAGAAADMGCPDGPDVDQLADACSGYALTADLDFDTDDDGGRGRGRCLRQLDARGRLGDDVRWPRAHDLQPDRDRRRQRPRAVRHDDDEFDDPCAGPTRRPGDGHRRPAGRAGGHDERQGPSGVRDGSGVGRRRGGRPGGRDAGRRRRRSWRRTRRWRWNARPTRPGRAPAGSRPATTARSRRATRRAR